MRFQCVPPTRVLVLVLAIVSGVSRSAHAQSLPSSWLSSDIGSVSPDGSASYTDGVFTIAGGGPDIWGASDEFRFVYQQISGDVEVIARVDSLDDGDPWMKVGVMLRRSLDASSAYAFTAISPGDGLLFQQRAQDGDHSTKVTGAPVSVPAWVRIVRKGSRVSSYSSADGLAWSQIASVTFSLDTSVYAGLAITSHNSSTRAEAQLSNVSVRTIALPSPQASRDLGSPAVRGSTLYSQGTYTMVGGGADIWDASDQFQFAYQAITGDADIAVRVAAVTPVSSWTKAGVMIRETLTADSRHAFALVSGSSGTAFQRRIDQGGYSQGTSGGSEFAPVWLRLVRAGYQIEAFRSSDGAQWTSIGSDTIPMADTVYVGLAVTSHDPSLGATATLDNFSLSQNGSTVANQPPLITLTSPADGATFGSLVSIELSATASDPEGQLQRVEFYVGNSLIATDTTSPYSRSWLPSLPGTYVVTAIAYDASGASTRSPSSTIAVGALTSSVPKTVTFQASADHSTSVVTNYVLEVFVNTADLAAHLPLTSSDLGKPAPDTNGDISVDQSSLFTALPTGTYFATVSAVGPGGVGQSTSVTFTR
jgi:regulation of enolase protein 1 (concanavalin A-like superfamily)